MAAKKRKKGLRRAKKRGSATRPKKRATPRKSKKRSPARKRRSARREAVGGPRRARRMRALPVTPVLSGPSWVARFPGSRSTADLNPTFGAAVDAFIAAMRAGGATVQVSATFRPPERAYLMHFCWQIAGGLDERQVPPKQGVDINWAHPTHEESVAAARAMVQGYGMVHRAALTSRHTERRAVDMTITWNGDLAIRTAAGATRTISSLPRTGANMELHAVGLGYGVIKLVSDPPHWSEDGR